jgi:hypothetical protein
MRPPLRSIMHTRIPRADHNTAELTPKGPSGSMAGRRSPGRDLGPDSTAKPHLRSLRHVVRVGTKMGRGTCHGERPSFPPPPVLGRSTLGAVDMPIGCALTFLLLFKASHRATKPSDAANLMCLCAAAHTPDRIGEITSTASQGYGVPRPHTASTRESLGARSACARAGAPYGRKTAPG